MQKHPAGKEIFPSTLLSAVEFSLLPSDKLLNSSSVQLRQKVIEDVYSKIQNINLNQFFIKPHFLRKHIILRFLVLIMIIFILLIKMFFPLEMKTAFSRWCFGENETWPTHQILIWDKLPAKMTQGDDFISRIFVKNEKNEKTHYLPPFLYVAVEYLRPAEASSLQNSSISSESWLPPEIYQITPVDGEFWVRIPSVRQNFRITAYSREEKFSPELAAQRGKSINILPLPHLTTSKIIIFPPPYTGEKPFLGQWMLRGLPGTLAHISVTADRAISSAKLCLDTGAYTYGKINKNDPKNISFQAEILDSCNYFLELLTEDGVFRRLETWRMEKWEDLPPTVFLRTPKTHHTILPQARIRIKVAAEDDYGLQKLGFRWLIQPHSDDLKTSKIEENSSIKNISEIENLKKDNLKENITPPQRIRWTSFDLWNATTENHLGKRSVKKKQEETFLWDISNFYFSPGTQIRLQAYAEDAKNPRAAGNDIFLEVISEEEMGKRITLTWRQTIREIHRLTTIFQEMEENLNTVNPEISPAKETWENTLNTIHSLLHSTERLLDPKYTDSLLANLEKIRQILEENPTFLLQDERSSKFLLREVRQTERILKEIHNSRIPRFRQKIVSSLKTWENLWNAQNISPQVSSEIKGNTLKHQFPEIKNDLHEILLCLMPMIHHFVREDSTNRHHETLSHILEEQKALSEKTEFLFRQNIGISSDFLDKETRIETEILWQRQFQLFAQFEQLYSQITSLFPDSDIPLISEEMKDHIILALQQNRLSAAAELQRQWITSLTELQSFLTFQKTESTAWMKSHVSVPGKALLLLKDTLQDACQKQYFITHSTEELHHSLFSGIPASARAIRLQNNIFTKTQREILQNIIPFLNENASLHLPISIQKTLKMVISELKLSADYFSSHATISLEQRLLQKKIHEHLEALHSTLAFFPADTLLMEDDISNSETKDSSKAESQNENTSQEKPESVTIFDIQFLRHSQQQILQRTQTADSLKSESSEFLILAAELTAAEKELLALAEEILLPFSSVTDESIQKNSPRSRNDAFASILAQMSQVTRLFQEYDLSNFNIRIQEDIIFQLEMCMRRTSTDQGNLQTQEEKAQQNSLSENSLSEENKISPDSPGYGNIPEETSETSPSGSAGSGNIPETSNIPEPTVISHAAISEDTWNELPVRIQKKIESLPSEEWIPVYRTMIEAYFQILAKENQKGGVTHK
ncbi:MAG: hypothetical protein Q4C96_04305 [Planctomycetia bacterium]|nr:hypothetical protein [Planctomycetia bacterium]